MKTCPVCGLDVEDSYQFCPDDGSALVDYGAIEASLSTANTVANPETGDSASTFNNAVISYCGECAAEYPMTFAECPVHHVLLTRKRLPTIAEQLDKPAESASIEPSPEVIPDDQNYEAALVSSANDATDEPQEVASIEPSPESATSAQAYGATLFATREEAPGFRIVAAAIVVGLVLFCVAAVYIFFSAGSRRQLAARASLPAASADAEESAFVATPDSARDYQEEQPQQASDETQTSPQQDETHSAAKPSTPPLETAGADSHNAKTETGSAKPTPVSMYRTSSANGAGSSPGGSMPSASREPSSPRLDSGSVDARLIRVRSMRTASGVRYDLTFDLQDESGRHSQWERMLVSTRSGSGVSQTQTVPFVHRLGANGALTFTVSVEMRGHSEPDWRGRVVCTTSGADIDGRPLRASFGTNVTP